MAATGTHGQGLTGAACSLRTPMHARVVEGKRENQVEEQAEQERQGLVLGSGGSRARARPRPAPPGLAEPAAPEAGGRGGRRKSVLQVRPGAAPGDFRGRLRARAWGSREVSPEGLEPRSPGDSPSRFSCRHPLSPARSKGWRR